MLWQPFSEQNAGVYTIERNLYKNTCGNKVIFEEINHDLESDLQLPMGCERAFRIHAAGTTQVFRIKTHAR